MPRLKLSVERLKVDAFDTGRGEMDRLAAISRTHCCSHDGEYCVPQPVPRTCGC